jgi:hypothetical protein
MKSTNVKGLVAKAMMVGLTAGALMFVTPMKSQAQQFAVGVQFGHPAYVYDHDGYRHDRDGYWYDRDGYRRDDFRDRERREAVEQRQAYLRHEQWEHAQRFHHDDYR